jgi:hypothetical protein
VSDKANTAVVVLKARVVKTFFRHVLFWHHAGFLINYFNATASK